tara:strand:+ start:16431 stop:16988 length:558 start_codon:yes stop_codon:yes gene_type:complete
MNTRIEIILGCMFSGKTTEMLRRCNRYKAIGKQILIINHELDSRTDNSVLTHDGNKQSALKIENLMDLITDKKYRDILYNTSVIGIDEAQFFGDLVEFIVEIEKLNKIIIISGLDGDSDRKPFGKILQCIPLCDTVVKLNALDMKKKDGTPAIFTKRIINNSHQVLIGNADAYMAVSRESYFNNN